MVYNFEEKLGKKFLREEMFGTSKPTSRQAESFFEYFSSIRTKSYIFEEQYVDKDYLKDYSNYYARCLHPYPKNCSRIHFFNKKFKKRDLLNLLKDKSAKSSFYKQLQKAYQGFVVIRRLPTRIGRTCLKTYPEVLRKYPVTRNYEVNLYGLELKVKTLAYQQQDGNVAVCASSALWSAAHQTAHLFQHKLPSPSEITKLATSLTPYSRSFPNNGLTAEQIGVGIAGLGLDPQILTLSSEKMIKGIIYAYASCGIPLILGITLDTFNKKKRRSEHAVTLAGYGFEKQEADMYQYGDIQLYSSRITKLYCHDDQLCPFARMTFEKNETKVLDEYVTLLKTSWVDGKGLELKANIDVILIPLYDKIRVPYELIYNLIRDFNIYIDDLIFSLHKKNSDYKIPYIEWDIKLSKVNDFKREIQELGKREIHSDKIKILKGFYSKYIWRAVATIDQERQFEFILDATDINNGNLLLEIIQYQKDYYNYFKRMHTRYGAQNVSTSFQVQPQKIINKNTNLLNLLSKL